MNEIARELMKEARKNARLKQAELADRLDVKGTTISNWEKGVASPDIDSFVAYRKLCGVDYGKLLNIAYGDPQEEQTPREQVECTTEEVELVRKYRAIDERGKRTVRRILNAEYEDAMALLSSEDKKP